MVQAAPALRAAIDAHVVGRRMTGNETYVVSLATALARRTDVRPIAYVDPGTAWPTPDGPTIRELRLRAPYLRIPVELPWRARRDGADLLHVQYVAPPVARLPLVTAIHDVSFEDVPGLFRRATELRLKTLVRLSARRSAAIITISEFTKSRIVHHYGISPDRIVVTPLGVEPFWHAVSAGESDAVATRLDLPGAFVLAVGNLHPRKNIARLVRAVAMVREQGGDLGLVLAGQRGWHATDVDDAIVAVDGRAWVRELGYVSNEQLRALYSAASVVAYPSIYEGFGLPVLEALACGAVVVAASTTAIPEVAGDAAILVDPESPPGLADALGRATFDEVARQRLRKAGPIQASQFTWESCAARTVEAYRSAVSRFAVSGTT